ncbi:MAG: hypothetical protein ACP5MH_11835 [Thermoproteus sp.]
MRKTIYWKVEVYLPIEDTIVAILGEKDGRELAELVLDFLNTDDKAVEDLTKIVQELSSALMPFVFLASMAKLLETRKQYKLAAKLVQAVESVLG